MVEQTIHTVFAVAVPTLAVLIGILINNSRLNDLRAHMDVRFSDVGRRIDDLKELQQANLRLVEEVMDARLSRIEDDLHSR